MRSQGRTKVFAFILFAFAALSTRYPLPIAAFSAELPAHPLAQAQEELKLLWMKYGRDGVPYATCNIGSAVYVVGYSGWARAVIEARDMNTGELLDSWEHTYGNITALYDCAVLDGYLYAVGVDNAPGNEEWLILKFTSDLKLVSEMHYNPSNSDDEAWIIVTDRENLYIGGYDSFNGGKDLRWHLIKVNPSDLSILKSYVSDPSNGWDELHSVSVNPIDGKIWLIGSVNALSSGEVHGRIEVLDKDLSLLATKDVQNPLLCMVFDEMGFAYIPAPPQWLLKVSPDLQQIDIEPFSHIPYKMVYSEGRFYLAITSGAGFFKHVLVSITKNLDTETTLTLSPEDYEDYFFEPIGKMIIANNKLFVAGCAVKSGEKKWVIYSVAQTNKEGTYLITFLTEPPDTGIITFAGTNYTNGQSGVYAPGTYQIEANTPQGYVFYRWITSEGVSVADPALQQTTASITGNGSIIALFMWFVKLKGTVISHRQSWLKYFGGYPAVEVKVEKVLLDTSNRLKAGEVIEVYRETPFSEINDGDHVEVYGLGFWIGSPAGGPYVEHGVIIKWSDHYVKRIEEELEMNVKFKGTILSFSPDYVDWKIKIEEILWDPSGKLKVGEEVPVAAHNDSYPNSGKPWVIGELNIGDKVEIYGEYFSEPSSYVWVHKSYHYIKKISGKLNIDVWTNRGGKDVGNLNGGIYSIDEDASFYCNVEGDVSFLKVWVESPDGSVTILFENFNVKAGTYEFKELIKGPSGEWKLKAVACPAGQNCPSENKLSKDETRYYVRRAGEPRCAVLVTLKPDTPTIDEEVEFTLLINCENDSEVKNIGLYVDGALAKKWQGTGAFTFSKKYNAGIHTYHLAIVDANDQEFRVPATGEYSFNVLIAEGVAGPPTLWIAPFEIVVEYEGKSYRAFYAINISASDIPPDPNKDRTAFYTWMYTKRNWYVLDSSNQVVTDEDVYVKIAIAAETAFNILGKNPDYLRERAYFFRDMKFYGTVATILKKIGEHLAGYIPKAALGSAMPSAVGVERFGVIVEFADCIKKLEKVDVDSAITLVAFGYLTDAENALLRASELAEPVYSELMSNPSSPKAHIEYSKMLEFNKLIRNESKGFAGINMLYQLHREGVKGYIESVIKAIIASADPSGLSAVASKIQEVPEVREFFDQMCAWEAEQHIRDAAFERGARSFAKIAREYAETTKRGDSGGVVTVREGKIVSLEAASGVEIRGEVQNRKIVLIVDSNTPRGKTITVDLDSKSLPITKIEEVAVIFDGEKIKMVDDLADVLNPNDDEKPEYFILWGSKGAQVFISIPSFSAHTIEIIHTPSIQGDVNNDGLVDYRDLATVVARYGSRQGDPSYLEAADVNLDGVIDYKDLALVVSHYGESR
jgi:hypothetical protein